MKAADRIKGSLTPLLKQLNGLDWMTLSQRLMLLDLLLRPIGGWEVRPLILLLSAAGLLVPRLQRHPALWLLLTILSALRVYADWPMSDNHAYVIPYWCLANFLALQSSTPRENLALSGRLLIGLIFLFATAQKGFISPDFMDGRFFRQTLVLDSRFQDFTLLLGGLDRDELERNREFLEPDPRADDRSPARPQSFHEPPALGNLAWALTWSTVILEGLLAIAFLWPTRGWFFRIRHGLLITFCISTFAVATVAGFGWLLIIMGVAQSREASLQTRWAYLITFALILVYREVPWGEVLVQWRAF